MTTNYVDARNQLNKLVNDAWKAGAAAIVGYVPELYWQGKTEPDTMPKDKISARVTVMPVDSAQTAMGMGSLQSKLRYTEIGIVTVQIFAPSNKGNAFENCGKLAAMIRNAFRGAETPGCVWFRNARLNPLSPDNGFERFNVVTDFQYDEIH